MEMTKTMLSHIKLSYIKITHSPIWAKVASSEQIGQPKVGGLFYLSEPLSDHARVFFRLGEPGSV